MIGEAHKCLSRPSTVHSRGGNCPLKELWTHVCSYRRVKYWSVFPRTLFADWPYKLGCRFRCFVGFVSIKRLGSSASTKSVPLRLRSTDSTWLVSARKTCQWGKSLRQYSRCLWSIFCSLAEGWFRGVKPRTRSSRRWTFSFWGKKIWCPHGSSVVDWSPTSHPPTR